MNLHMDGVKPRTMNSDTTALPPSTPMDVRLGMTRAEDVAFPLRWGIIGAGNISRQWVPALHACKGATVTAVAARSEDRAEAFAARYGIKRAYSDYAEMVASPDVDIVYVGTISRLHKEHGLLAIEAGKHVLCEKPLAQNAADARDMYAAAEEKNVMQRFEYPLPGTVSIPDAYPNQHGFLYQAEAVHRSLAAGLCQCPQYDKEASLATLDLLTRISDARRAAAKRQSGS